MTEPTSAIQIRTVTHDASATLRSTLVAAGLSPAGVDQGGRYWFALARGGIVGTIGLETAKAHGLLRSLSVPPSHRGAGIAGRLVAHVLDEAARLEHRQHERNR